MLLPTVSLTGPAFCLRRCTMVTMAGGKKKYDDGDSRRAAADPFAPADAGGSSCGAVATSDDDDAESCLSWSSAASCTSAKERKDLAALTRELLPELSSNPFFNPKKVSKGGSPSVADTAAIISKLLGLLSSV